MTKAKTNTVFNVYYLNSDGEQIDETQINENNEGLAWELFAEFGHIRKKGDRLEFKPVEE